MKISNDPKHAIITIPHLKRRGGPNAPYPILDGARFDLEDTVYISFQDTYLSFDSYFLTDNYGGNPVPTAADVVNRILNQYGLDDSNATLVGSSKGANIVASVSRHFDNTQLIVCTYSTDLEYRIRNSHYSHLATALNYFGLEFPDSLDILANEGTRKETHWFYSVEDHLANMGNEGVDYPRLHKYACDVDHSNVIVDNWNRIKGLICSFRDSK